MATFDNLQTNGACGEGVGPHRLCLVTTLLGRWGVATLSFARYRPRGPPIAT